MAKLVESYRAPVDPEIISGLCEMNSLGSSEELSCVAKRSVVSQVEAENELLSHFERLVESLIILRCTQKVFLESFYLGGAS